MSYKLLQSLFFAFFLFFSLSAYAQPPEGKGGKRLEALRIAYITEKLQLTPQEAQTFWPVFNEYQAKLKDIRKQGKLESLDDNSSDADIEKAVAAHFDAETKAIALQKEYFVQLKKILPLKKIVKLLKAEHEFKNRLLEHLRNRPNDGDDENPPPPPPPGRPRGRR
ncbi:MAG: hypothetical protein RI894_2299 [Bacteroidota bacterium]|jgi:hypothetical protein